MKRHETKLETATVAPEAPLLSKWWQTESAQRAWERVGAAKAERVKGMKQRFAAIKKSRAEKIAELDRQIWEDERSDRSVPVRRGEFKQNGYTAVAVA